MDCFWPPGGNAFSAATMNLFTESCLLTYTSSSSNEAVSGYCKSNINFLLAPFQFSTAHQIVGNCLCCLLQSCPFVLLFLLTQHIKTVNLNNVMLGSPHFFLLLFFPQYFSFFFLQSCLWPGARSY